MTSNIWERRLYTRDPVEELAQAGGEILISINASPYHMGKRALRREIFAATAQHHRMPVVYVNQVGGNDSAGVRRQQLRHGCRGQRDRIRGLFRAKTWSSGIPIPPHRRSATITCPTNARPSTQALVLGTRDYIRKCGFQKVLIGLSGGIDSSLTAAIAADAVGRENVVGVGMPGPFSSEGSVTDARALAQNLGIRFEIVPISAVYRRISATCSIRCSRVPARRHRREPAGPAARRHAHGAVQ